MIRHRIGQHVDGVEFEARECLGGDETTVLARTSDRPFYKDELLAVYREVLRATDVDDPELRSAALDSTVKPAIYRALRRVVSEYGSAYFNNAIRKEDAAPLRERELDAVLHLLVEESDD